MANALLDTVSRIYLVGEVALAALYALGIPTGKVERSEHNHKDYAKMTEFFNKLVTKAAHLQIPIILPTDFKVSTKIEIQQE